MKRGSSYPGTAPSGVAILNPKILYIATSVLSSLLSALTGSSFTTIFAVGIAFVGLAVRMGTVVRYGERTALDKNCGDVFFDGTEEWLYNDHEFGTPLLVVWPPSTEPRWEVSYFLLKVSAIIPASVDSVKPGRFLGLCWPALERSINVTSYLVSSRHSPGLTIYSGPKRPYSDQSIWPITPEQTGLWRGQGAEHPAGLVLVEDVQDRTHDFS